mmetsp:Transcript_22273/g.61568  ORF Transcript_22273/g.61568 Transcript_22273/m.61568 type:complete len:326 (+) Transcript_22273:71-1048(+)
MLRPSFAAAPWGLVALLLVAAAGSAAALPRGVDPSQAALYAGPTFTCKDGSKTIPIERVNDGYCDCFLDGSDEPGTPACYSGYFWCQNLGFEPQLLSTSFVDDGVCDCCDGSDEAPGKCQNTCLDRSASERQAVRDHVAFVRRALDEKQALISSAVEKQRAWQNRKGLISSEVSSQAAEVNKLQAQVKQAEAIAEADRQRLAQEAEAQQEAARAAEEARQQAGEQAADAAAEAARQQQQQQQQEQQQADAAQPPSQEPEGVQMSLQARILCVLVAMPLLVFIVGVCSAYASMTRRKRTKSVDDALPLSGSSHQLMGKRVRMRAKV